MTNRNEKLEQIISGFDPQMIEAVLSQLASNRAANPTPPDNSQSTKVLIYSRTLGAYLNADRSEYVHRFCDAGAFRRVDAEEFIATQPTSFPLEMEPFWWPDEVQSLHRAGLQQTFRAMKLTKELDLLKSTCEILVKARQLTGTSPEWWALFDEMAVLVESKEEN